MEQPIYMTPDGVATGTAEPVVVVHGVGFSRRMVVAWNGERRPTEFLNGYQLRVRLQPDDVKKPSLGWISVRDAESGVLARAARAFWVYLALPNNDVLYDAIRGRLWVAVSGERDATKHGIVLLDPETGATERTLPLAAEPQKLALTDDARYLYVATRGRVYRIATETLNVDSVFALPPSPFDAVPTEASSMLTVPGRPDQLVVSLAQANSGSLYMGTVLFQNGVPATDQLTRYEDGPRILYGWLDSTTILGGAAGSFYYLRIDNGVRVERVRKNVTVSPTACSRGGACTAAQAQCSTPRRVRTSASIRLGGQLECYRAPIEWRSSIRLCSYLAVAVCSDRLW
jgi:hypothetical protein